MNIILSLIFVSLSCWAGILDQNIVLFIGVIMSFYCVLLYEEENRI